VRVERGTRGTELARIASDPDAFERFYREHVEAVQRFVARRVDDPYLAADLTADVFLAAIDSAAGYDATRGNPAAWLYGIARNVIAGERRRDAREREAATRVRGRDLVEDDDLAVLLQRIDAESASRSLYRELERLSSGERAVLELVAVDGLGVGEAAEALHIGPVAARVRLHRARRLLRTRLPQSARAAIDLPEVSG
jgi:RNA polymerase sigma-70 factor (ECF subfamily)